MDTPPRERIPQVSAPSVPQSTANTRSDVPPPYCTGNECYLAGWAERALYDMDMGQTFEDGWQAGYDHAKRLMANALAETTQGLPDDAATILRRLVAGWEQTR